MPLEQQLEANTAALKDLVAIIGADMEARAAIAKRLPNKSDAASMGEDAAERKKADAAAKRKAAAEKKKADEAAAKDVKPRSSVDAKDLRKLAQGYLGIEDEAEREERRANAKGGLEHLGYALLADIDNEADMLRFAFYLDQWIAGQDVDFEESDAAFEDDDAGI